MSHVPGGPLGEVGATVVANKRQAEAGRKSLTGSVRCLIQDAHGGEGGVLA